MYPRYVTSVLQSWAFLVEVGYPRFPKVCESSLVALVHSGSEATVIKRSSTYWRMVIPGWTVRNSPRSSCRASSKMVGEFLNPWG